MQQITDDTLEEKVLKSAQPFLLDFSADRCAPCKAMMPLIEELAKEYADKISVGTIDIDKNPNTAIRFQVRGIPTLLMFNSGKVVGQLTGAHPKARIVDLIKKAL